jgi:hypothetical protein
MVLAAQQPDRGTAPGRPSEGVLGAAWGRLPWVTACAPSRKGQATWAETNTSSHLPLPAAPASSNGERMRAAVVARSRRSRSRCGSVPVIWKASLPRRRLGSHYSKYARLQHIRAQPPSACPAVVRSTRFEQASFAALQRGMLHSPLDRSFRATGDGRAGSKRLGVLRGLRRRRFQTSAASSSGDTGGSTPTSVAVQRCRLRRDRCGDQTLGRDNPIRRSAPRPRAALPADAAVPGSFAPEL